MSKLKNAKIEIIESGDGSKTLYLKEIDETYHSTHGAYQEAMHVFIERGLAYGLKNKECVSVLEIGFGTGLNAILTENYILYKQSKKVIYDTLEAYPVSNEIVHKMGYDQYVDERIFPDFKKMHVCSWGKEIVLRENFRFKKIKQKLEDVELAKAHYDIIYFDAFAPSRQAEMWELDKLKKCYDSLVDGGILITYCAKGQFKRDLKSLGFRVEMLPGPPGKREITRGIKTNNRD